MLGGPFRLTPAFTRQLPRLSSLRSRYVIPSIAQARNIHYTQAKMSCVSKACCSIPPAQAANYTPKGTYETIAGLKTYVTGPADATDAILMVYDIFGFYPQTQQGADILATSDAEHKYRIFMPDFFEGEPVDLSIFPPKTDEHKAQVANFFATKAVPEKTQTRLPGIISEANARFAPSGGAFKNWGIVGFCWGGKMSALACGNTNLFKVGVQCHPAMVDPADAEKITIPFATLASKDEDPATIQKFDANLKNEKFTDTYPTQIHGWMAARSNLADEEVKKEYERGYKTVLTFLHKHMADNKSKI